MDRLPACVFYSKPHASRPEEDPTSCSAQPLPHPILAYSALCTSGLQPPLAMPRLPPNAEYLEAPACAGSAWGMLAAAQQKLAHDLASAERIVVVTSAVRGPYMPPYTHEVGRGGCRAGLQQC